MITKLLTTTITITLFLLTGCFDVKLPDKIIKRDYTYKKGEVVYINHPKHFSVHVKFADGKVYELRSSKYCNNWRDRVKVGDVYNIPTEIQQYESGSIYHVYHVKSCDLIREDYKVNG